VSSDRSLPLVATCSLGLEELVAGELRDLGLPESTISRGAVAFSGSWADCWRTNWRLRTANRILLELATWEAHDGPALAAGGRALVTGRLLNATPGLDPAQLFHPDRTFSLQATSSASEIRDARWAALTVKDGLVDGQRDRWGRRANVDRESPDLQYRLRLHDNKASLLLDTSGEPLDHRGYRTTSGPAPVREQLAAACVLASGWDGKGAVVDPMCGSGTFLIEAGWFALGRAPGCLRTHWAFMLLPGYDAAAFETIRTEAVPIPDPEVQIFGNDQSGEALRASTANLKAARLLDRTTLKRSDAFTLTAPEKGPGLVIVNPPHGARIATEPEHWRKLGDLLKQQFRGWKAAVLAGGETRGKHIGLKPRRRIPVMNGPLEARILLFDLF
jgi:23S rRNA G2445 N2-methylase RlmL